MKIKLYTSWLVFFCGLILLLINLYGLTQLIRHPDLVSFDKYGNEFTPIDIRPEQLNGSDVFSINLSRKEALKKLNEILQLTDESIKIREIQKLVTNSMVHFYPVNEPYRSNYFHVPFHENFILYLGAKLFEITNVKAFSVFRPYEYLNGKKSWERGAAMCGEIASVTMYLLELAGIEHGKAGLDGHVIALARTSSGQEYIIDSDYGFVLSGSLDDVANNHLEEVYEMSSSRHLAKIYGPEGNIEFWNGDRGYRPKGFWFERISYFLKWLIPIFLLIFPLILIFLRKKL